MHSKSWAVSNKLPFVRNKNYKITNHKFYDQYVRNNEIILLKIYRTNSKLEKEIEELQEINRNLQEQ